MAERVQHRFLTANTPPPVPKPPYAHQAYPTWRYHENFGPRLIQNAAEAETLGEGWAETPFPEKPPVVELGIGEISSQATANLALLNRVMQENQDLVAENMSLKSELEDAKPAADKLKDLQTELQKTQRQLKDARSTLDNIERARTRIANEKAAAQRAAKKAAAPEMSLADVLASEPEQTEAAAE